MYENGKRVKGYQKKRLHKRKMKNSYAKAWCYGNGETSWNELVLEFKDEPKDRHGGHPLDYWKEYSLSGPRTLAKEQTNRALRREFKNQSRMIMIDDEYDYVSYLSNGNYRKYFDYDWTVW